MCRRRRVAQSGPVVPVAYSKQTEAFFTFPLHLNIRSFMEADQLRKRPNIKWGIDRGKNPPGSPWGEERDNDRHLTLAEKRKAQGK